LEVGKKYGLGVLGGLGEVRGYWGFEGEMVGVGWGDLSGDFFGLVVLLGNQLGV
jgi:hypothetical protein